jgi:hypothetical protein
LDELMDETIEDADPQVNVELELDGSNVAMAIAEDEVDLVIGKFFNCNFRLLTDFHCVQTMQFYPLLQCMQI